MGAAPTKCIPDHAGCRVLSERTTKSKAASPRAAWEDPHKWHFLAALWKHSWNVSSYQPQLHTSIKSNKQDKEQRTFTSIFPWHPSTEERVQTLKLMCNLTYYRDSLITASLRGSDSIQLNKKKKSTVSFKSTSQNPGLWSWLWQWLTSTVAQESLPISSFAAWDNVLYHPLTRIN